MLFFFGLPPQELQELADAVWELNARIEDDEDEEMEDMPAKQWTKVSGYGSYTAIGDTIAELPPGFYEPQVTQQGLFFMPVEAREDQLIRFPDSPTAEVLAEIETFWERENLYRFYGLPFKRGILLWGPAGSGKSSTLVLIARDVVQRGGIVLNFIPGNFQTALRVLREVQPKVPVVALMEDLDALIDRKESYVLNMLDGAESIDRVVFLATTNYPEKLDPRVQNRPSRFDRRIEVPHPTPANRRVYLESLLKCDPAEINVEQYVEATEGMSLAHLKELFVATVVIGLPFGNAIDNLRKMNRRPAQSSYGYEFDEEIGERGYA